MVSVVMKRLGRRNLFSLFLYVFLFLFFVTLHADQLSVHISIFNFRLNNLLALILGVVFFCFFKTGVLEFKKEIAVGVIAFLFVSALSSFFSIYGYRTRFYLCFAGFTVLFYFLLPYLMMMFFDEKKLLKVYWLSFCVVGLYACGQLVLSMAGINDPAMRQRMMFFGRPNALAYEPSYYALYMAPYTFFINSMAIVGGQKDKKTDVSKIIWANIFFIVSTSTGVLYAYMVFAVITFLLMSSHVRQFSLKNTKRFLAFLAICLIVLLFGSIFMEDFFAASFFKFFIAGTQHHSFLLRWQGLVDSWNVFLENPVFGVGLGGIAPYTAKMLGHNISVVDIKKFEPMNVTMELFASLGIVGVLSCLALFIMYYKSYKRARENPCVDKYEKNVVFSLFVSTLVMLVVLQFNAGLFRTYIWVHIAITWAYMNKINKKATLQSASECID